MKTLLGARTAALRSGVKLLTLALAGACVPVSGAVPDDLLTYLGTTYPGATVLAAEEVDTGSCGPASVGAQPGFVAGDLDGDGSDDYGVLLRGEREQHVYEGRSYDAYQVTLAIVLNTPGGYRSVWETSSLESQPIGVVLAPASVSESLPTGQREHLSNPPLDQVRAATDRGIVLSYCEKSSSLFFWDGGRIVEYSLTD